eukprot:4893908-Amphidinium_carterae.1
MKAPAKPSNPAPVMKPPPNRPEGPMEMVRVQPTHRPGYKPPPAGYKPPPAGVPVPPWNPAATPAPSSSPAGVKTPFKGPPVGHPDYQEVVPITYLPFTPKAGKKPPPELPVVPQQGLYKPPPAPGYARLSRDEHAKAQEVYEREMANRRSRAAELTVPATTTTTTIATTVQGLRHQALSLETGQEQGRMKRK